MAMSRPDRSPVHTHDSSPARMGPYSEDTGGDQLRINAFDNADVAFDPLSTNRRFPAIADLAVLGTLVFGGPTLSITELCRLGYPQSSPELRQELISEQFVRGQSDPELKKYLWVVIRTQKDRKRQTLIEVCTDFVSLGQTTSVHRPAEQILALE